MQIGNKGQCSLEEVVLPNSSIQKKRNAFLMQRPTRQDTHLRLTKPHSTAVQVRRWKSTIKEHSVQQFELSLFQSVCHLSLLIICCLAREEFSSYSLLTPHFFPSSFLPLCFYLWASKSYLASLKGLWMSRKRKTEYSKLV